MIRVEGNKVTIDAPNAVVEAHLDKSHIRVPGELRWIASTEKRNIPSVTHPAPTAEARAEQESIWKKAAGFLSSIGSVITTGGFVSPEVEAERQASCVSCPYKVQRGDKSYCGVCGCGATSWAELDFKLKLPYLTCPLSRLGFSNAKETDK